MEKYAKIHSNSKQSKSSFGGRSLNWRKIDVCIEMNHHSVIFIANVVILCRQFKRKNIESINELDRADKVGKYCEMPR